MSSYTSLRTSSQLLIVVMPDKLYNLPCVTTMHCNAFNFVWCYSFSMEPQWTKKVSIDPLATHYNTQVKTMLQAQFFIYYHELIAHSY